MENKQTTDVVEEQGQKENVTGVVTGDTQEGVKVNPGSENAPEVGSEDQSQAKESKLIKKAKAYFSYNKTYVIEALLETVVSKEFADKLGAILESDTISAALTRKECNRLDDLFRFIRSREDNFEFNKRQYWRTQEVSEDDVKKLFFLFRKLQKFTHALIIPMQYELKINKVVKESVYASHDVHSSKVKDIIKRDGQGISSTLVILEKIAEYYNEMDDEFGKHVKIKKSDFISLDNIFIKDISKRMQEYAKRHESEIIADPEVMSVKRKEMFKQHIQQQLGMSEDMAAHAYDEVERMIGDGTFVDKLFADDAPEWMPESLKFIFMGDGSGRVSEEFIKEHETKFITDPEEISKFIQQAIASGHAHDATPIVVKMLEERRANKAAAVENVEGENKTTEESAAGTNENKEE